MSSKQLIINCTSFETRVALIESGQVSEFYIERDSDRGIVGNIYKGRVSRVLPGMQSAFVDIGLERAAFLFAGDIQPQDDNDEGLLPPVVGDDEDASKNDDDEDERRHHHHHKKITDLVKEGDEILVEVAKDAIGTKGARITTYLSFPGRYVVLMPNIRHVGVSRRIQSEEERTRLKNVVNKAKPDGVGIIVRTASEGISDEKITADVEFLVKLWENLKQKASQTPAPCLVHEDLNLVFRATRDLLSKDLDRIVIDDRNHYLNLVRFLNRFSVKLGAQVHLYEGDVALFDAFGIEAEIHRALDKKVWLKSGGYLVIEQTEALTAVDVNTGRFVGNRSLGETIVKTNIEAAREIVFQLRLRNIGGIIILDFIDMDRADDRDKVFAVLQDELKKDKARTTALRISEMGLVQMTRKRTEESLAQKLCSPCSYCNGTGKVKSATTVAYEVIRELNKESIRETQAPGFLLRVHPEVADRLLENEVKHIKKIENDFQKKISVKSINDFHIEQFEITTFFKI